MNTIQLTRAKQALLRDLDQALQISYRQRLGEVLNDLRTHDVDLSPNPSPDDVFALVRRTRLLWHSSLPAMVEVRDSLERLSAGTYGTCSRCGKPISDETINANPEAKFCRHCVS
ncbi:MAG: TraR/DksA C4-type zinc finger protein [Ignavibacteriales bacterium]|nr:TraR/DksA C4-type zinc finger protein [Ignavibacteriales bacterium]